MIAVDTNVLIAAHRTEHPMHERARDALRALAEGSVPWALPVFCIAEFLRVVTHPRLFRPPTGLDQAIEAVERLLASPQIRLLQPERRYWFRFREVLRDGEARGNLVFDAQVAAVCAEHGVRSLLTGDRDFARFSAIRPRSL